MSLAQRLARPEILARRDASASRADAPWPDDALRLDRAGLPFPPLVDGPLAAGANRPPEPRPAALERALAALYGVGPHNVLAVRDVKDGAERLIRAFCRPGGASAAAAEGLDLPVADMVALAGAKAAALGAEGVRLAFVGPPAAAALADASPRTLIVADESFVEFHDAPSLAPLAAARENLIVLRTLSHAFGLAGAKVGAVIAHRDTVDLLAEAFADGAIPTPCVAAALAVLSPSRRPLHAARITAVRQSRARLAEALAAAPDFVEVREGPGPFVLARARDPDALAARLRERAIRIAFLAGGEVRIAAGDDGETAALLAALGLDAPSRPGRRAEVVRDTRETRIAVAVDLDAAEPRSVATGIAFFDHMLDQVAAHGGFSLTLACEGDLDVDAHHTIEDCALAFGGALSKALGERRGIGRFGFSLPMDEAQAHVLVDLSGRPYDLFAGEFAASHIGAWPTEMTAHVFRSFSQSLGAAIHVEVSGQNDHHKTEAAFKAFGRALRQAIGRTGEPDVLPTTKGVL